MIYFVESQVLEELLKMQKTKIPKIIVNQDYKMRFDTNINSTLDWKFFPEKKIL